MGIKIEIESRFHLRMCLISHSTDLSSTLFCKRASISFRGCPYSPIPFSFDRRTKENTLLKLTPLVSSRSSMDRTSVSGTEDLGSTPSGSTSQQLSGSPGKRHFIRAVRFESSWGRHPSNNKKTAGSWLLLRGFRGGSFPNFCIKTTLGLRREG